MRRHPLVGVVPVHGDVRQRAEGADAAVPEPRGPLHVQRGADAEGALHSRQARLHRQPHRGQE